MAKVSKSEKKKKKKTREESTKSKLGKVNSKNKLEVASSKVKKKKKKKRSDQEEVLEKKLKKAPVSGYADEDDIGDDDPSEDEDIVSVETEEDEGASAVDTDNDGEEDEVDLAGIDAGPDVSEVPCGFNCASCTKFVKLDDPIRQDPEWLTEQVSKRAKSRCPYLFPDEIEVPENKNLNDFIVRADSRACDHIHFNEDRAPAHLTTLLKIIRTETAREELDLVAHLVDRIRGLKSEEDKHGYVLGEQMRVRYKTKDGEQNIKCEVIEFQRKKGSEVIVRPMVKIKGVPSRLAVPARRAVVVD